MTKNFYSFRQKPIVSNFQHLSGNPEFSGNYYRPAWRVGTFFRRKSNFSISFHFLKKQNFRDATAGPLKTSGEEEEEEEGVTTTAVATVEKVSAARAAVRTENVLSVPDLGTAGGT